MAEVGSGSTMREEYFAVDSSQTVDPTAEGIAAKRVLAVIPRMGFMETTSSRPPHCEGWGKDTKTLGHTRLESHSAGSRAGSRWSC